MSKCKDCEKYKGNCGHHFKDTNGHIMWDTPSESMYDGVIGDTPKCFIPSKAYQEKCNNKVIKELARSYSVEFLKAAVEYKIKHDPQVSPCIRKKCSSPETCCGCDDYERWKEEENE